MPKAVAAKRLTPTPISVSAACAVFHTALACVHRRFEELHAIDIADVYDRFPTSLRIEAIGQSVYFERDITTAMFRGALSKAEGKKHLEQFRRLKAAHDAELKRRGRTAAEKRLEKARAELEAAAAAVVEAGCVDVGELHAKMKATTAYLGRGDVYGPRPSWPHDRTLWASSLRDAKALAEQVAGKAVAA